MQISFYDRNKLEDAYGILCRSIHQEFVKDFTPFGLVFCKVLAHQSTAPHQHHENEVFLIVSGQGKMQIGEEYEDIQGGDVVFIPAKSTHQLTNTTSEDLDFYSIYWTIAKNTTNSSAVEIIIPAPPTPNGTLHLGHLSGPYLAADIAHRANILFKKKSFYVMGTDDYQSYVGAKARQDKCTENEIIEKFAPKISQVIRDFGSDVNYFLKPIGDPDYREFVTQFFLDLKSDGIIKVSKRKAPRCTTTKTILYGSAIEGLCPNCNETTGGNGCENCGHYNDAWDLIDAKSTIGEGGIDYIDVKRSYIDLENHRPYLEEFIDQISISAVMRRFYLDYLQTKLPCVSLSQPSSWGIKVPGEDGNVIYEWCEMAGGYLYLIEKMKKEHSYLDFSHLQLNLAFGFDNAFFYGLLIPVLLKNKGIAWQSLLTNYFLHLNGQKFSTSRNHAIWGKDVLEKIHPDPLRFYLSLIRSELCTTNFKMKHFQSFLESLLKWENLLRQINNLVSSFPLVLSSNKKMSEIEERFLFYFNRSCTETISYYNIKTFRLNKVARYLLDIMDQLNDFYYLSVVGHKNMDLSLLLLTLRRCIALLQPIMPGYSNKLLCCFEFDETFTIEKPIDGSCCGKWTQPFPTSFIQDNVDFLEKM